MTKRQIFKTLMTLAVPMMLQNLLHSSLSFADTLMIGQLGDRAVASVGIAGQLIFIYSIVQFGIHTGLSVYTSQYGGKGDIRRIRHILGIQILTGGTALLLFLILIYPAPRIFVSLYSEDPLIIDRAVSYLRINGISLVCSVPVYAFTANLRSTGKVGLPLISSLASVAVNLALNRVFIFGIGPIPPSGVEGAALASAIARAVDCAILVSFTYGLKYPSAAGLRDMFGFRFSFLIKVLRTSWPVFMNELCWVLGISLYNWVYATLGTESIAAVNIAASIENFLYTPFFGMFGAASVIIGNRIGEGNRPAARKSGAFIISFHAVLAFITGILLILFRHKVLDFYRISELTRFYASELLLVMALVMTLRVINYTFNVSVFRGGGDTKYSLFLDFSGVWLIGVPLALAGGLILKLPVHRLMSLVVLEEVYKAVLAFRRFRSGKWIRVLV